MPSASWPSARSSACGASSCNSASRPRTTSPARARPARSAPPAPRPGSEHNLEYRVEKAANLPFGDDEFEVATAIEVLGHVPAPEHTVAEMARVANRHLLLSVPREPLCRALNLARGAYLTDLGNTPGH